MAIRSFATKLAARSKVFTGSSAAGAHSRTFIHSAVPRLGARKLPVPWLIPQTQSCHRCVLITRQLSATSLHRAPLASSADSLLSPDVPNPLSEVPTVAVETSAHGQWVADAAQTLAEGETFASLGLGGYTPVGLIQTSMELIHNSTGLPWWGTIVAATLCIRVALLPLTIYLQKNSIRMHNVNPLVQEMKENQQLYMLAGDVEMANHERNRMNAVFREHGVRPVFSLVPAIFQGVVMISFFMSLRKMASVPVVSMMSGGALWFPDLTAADPSFMLPIFSSAAFLISLELGGDAGVVNPQMDKFKIAMRCFALVMIGVTVKFPACVFLYWLPSTVFSICNALVLKIPAVRSAVGLNIVKQSTEPDKEKKTVYENWKTKRLVKEKQLELSEANARYKKQKKTLKPVLYSQKPPPKNKKR